MNHPRERMRVGAVRNAPPGGPGSFFRSTDRIGTTPFKSRSPKERHLLKTWARRLIRRQTGISEAITMDTSELLQSINAQGHKLMAGNAMPDDMARGLGLALLALEELLKPTAAKEPLSAAPETAAPAFKAKSSRW
jgi:hypothetical protein